MSWGKKEARVRQPHELTQLESLIPGFLGLPLEPKKMTAADQIELLRASGVPINFQTVGHLYSNLDELAPEIRKELLSVADAQLFKQLILQTFKRSLQTVSESTSDLAETLHSLMITENGQYDPRFSQSPTAQDVLETFEGIYFDYRPYPAIEALVPEGEELEGNYEIHQAMMRAIAVWLDPYPKDVRDDILFELEHMIFRRKIEKDRETKAAAKIVDVSEEFDSLSKRKQAEYLDFHLVTLTKSDPEKALHIFTNLTEKQSLVYVRGVVLSFLTAERIAEATTCLRYTLNHLQLLPRKEERMKQRAELRLRSERPLPKEIKPKIETNNDEYLQLVELCEMLSDFESLSAILNIISPEEFQSLCHDLGVTDQQFSALLTWSFFELENASDFHPERSDYYYYPLKDFLNTRVMDSTGRNISNTYNKLYAKIVELRIRVFGEDGIQSLKEQIYQDKDFVRTVLTQYLEQGDLVNARDWAQRYYQISLTQGWNYYSNIGELLAKVSKE